MSKLSTIQETLRVATALVVILLWFVVSPTTALFWSLFLVWAVFKLDSRFIAGGALVLLVLIPIAQSIEGYEAWAEQLAVYVFFLLCITVALQILEMWREPAADTDEDGLKTDEVEAEEKSGSEHAPTPNYTEVESPKVRRSPKKHDIRPVKKKL